MIQRKKTKNQLRKKGEKNNKQSREFIVTRRRKKGTRIFLDILKEKCFFFAQNGDFSYYEILSIKFIKFIKCKKKDTL